MSELLSVTQDQVPAIPDSRLHNMELENTSSDEVRGIMESDTQGEINSGCDTPEELSVQKPTKTYKRTLFSNEFINPKKTIKAKVTTPVPVSTNNYFTPLTIIETATTSTTSSTAEPANTNNKKASQPPPLVVDKKNVNSTLLGQLKQLMKQEYKSLYNTQGLRVQTSCYEDFNALQFYLSSNKIQYFTYQKASETPVKVVLRGLPPAISEEEILVELQNLQYPVISVRQFKKLNYSEMSNERIKVPLPLWAISLHNVEGVIGKIKNMTGLFHLTVKVEDYIGNTGPTQCFRCQRFGHKAAGCNILPKCVKCGGSHFTKECTKDPATPATCCNCKGEHPANYRQCPKYQAYTKTTRASSSTGASTSTSSSSPPQITNKNFPCLKPSRSDIPGFKKQDPQDKSSTTMNDIKEIISFLKSLNFGNVMASIKNVLQNVSKQNDTISKCTVLISGLFSIFENGQDN